jgi:transposase-like protein
MSTLSKEVLREMIAEGNLKTAGDLHSYLKDMFKDVLQEMLEAELETELGYSKGDKKISRQIKEETVIQKKLLKLDLEKCQ